MEQKEMMNDNEMRPMDSAPSTGVTPLKGAELSVHLNHFIKTPQDPSLERRFASALIEARFVGLIRINSAGHVSGDDVVQMMQMGIGITTYLADGQKYIPVFTDEMTCQEFMRQSAPDMTLRGFSFTTAELMTEANRLGIAGVLINPGKQSFPLTNDYWDYISRVQPVLPEDAGPFSIGLVTVDKMKLTRTLQKAAKKIRGIRRLWLVNVKQGNSASEEVTVIADYAGQQQKFDKKIAPELARACRSILDYGQDVLVGTTMDDMGKRIAAQAAPIYEATDMFGRRRNYD